jgi:hypothetical protein
MPDREDFFYCGFFGGNVAVNLVTVGVVVGQSRMNLSQREALYLRRDFFRRKAQLRARNAGPCGSLATSQSESRYLLWPAY